MRKTIDESEKKTKANSFNCRLQTLVSRWRLFPKIEYVDMAKEFPNSAKICWKKWFSVEKYWMGRLIYIHFKAKTFILDFRRNWLYDMIKPTD